ncbi:MAG: peptidoglycan editing factor PgeF [Pseudomonadota bacterium]
MSLSPITSDALRGVSHGFFSREGGVSVGLYASLNGGPGSRDDASSVSENRSRIAAHLGGTVLVSTAQVHSDQVVTVSQPWGEDRPNADAMVTDRAGIALGVLTADCAPVLLADTQSGVIGAAHAGWKGAVGGVLEAVVDAMVRLGANPETIAAAIGPTIGQTAYEVGPEFVERFLDDDPDTAQFFAGGREDRAQFDLPGYVRWRLAASGVEASWTGHCTYSDQARFFSYRRATHAGEADYGRLVSAIVLRDDP